MNTPPETAAPTATIRSTLRQYLAHYQAKGRTPTTIAAEKRFLGTLTAALAGQGIQTPAAIGPADVAAYAAGLHAHKHPRTQRAVAVHYVRNRLRAARQYFAWLAISGYIFTDLAARITLPKQPRALPKNIPGFDRVSRLIETPDAGGPLGLRDRAIFETLYSTGIRRSELTRLDRDDIDFRDGTLRIVQGKGQKDRIVPIGEKARQRVQQYLPTRKPRPGETALFLTQHGWRITPETLGYIVHHHAIRETDLVPDSVPITPHALRHAFATHMLRGGADIRHIQQMLGHAKITTTQLYTHLCPLDLKDAHRKSHPRGRWKKGLKIVLHRDTMKLAP